MRYLKFLVFPILITALLSIPSSAAPQVSVNIGAEPGCPYGYYDFAPYSCAPYGYYGPEWFNGGVFIGAGPWFHGANEFRGHVDNRFHPEHGYHGDFPNRGDRPRDGWHGTRMKREMGGNGAAIVLADADPRLVARLVGRHTNQHYGQTCCTIHRKPRLNFATTS